MRPPSFRGVRFGVRSLETSGLGRRAQTHEYPMRSTVFTEDLGAPPKVYSFEAFVAWGQAREELIAVCSLPTPGTLIHPLFGARQVVCTGCDERLGKEAVGTAFFGLTFVDQGENLFPVERAETRNRVDESVTDGRAAAQTSFLGRFTGSVPQWVNTSTAGWVTSLSGSIDATVRRMQGSIDFAEFARIADPLKTATATLVGSPDMLGSTISETIRRLAQLSSAPFASIRALESLARFGDDLETINPSTQNRARQLERQDGLVRLVRASTALEASLLAASVPLDSYDTAVTLRERIDGLVVPELEAAGERGDDALLGALRTVRAEIARDLKLRGAELARVRVLTLDSTIPVLVLAHRLYGDPTRAADLVTRNRSIRNPTFVPAGVELETLSV